MPKVISCKDAGVDCDFVARGETEEELFRNALEHGRTFHGMKEIPKDLQEKMGSSSGRKKRRRRGPDNKIPPIFEGPGFCPGPSLRIESGCVDPGSGNSSGFPRQRYPREPPFHPENAGCLRGVCSPYASSPKDSPDSQYYPLRAAPKMPGRCKSPGLTANRVRRRPTSSARRWVTNQGGLGKREKRPFVRQRGKGSKGA